MFELIINGYAVQPEQLAIPLMVVFAFVSRFIGYAIRDNGDA